MLQGFLNSDTVTVEVKNLSSKDIPGLIVIDEQSRRLYDYFLMSQGEVPAGFPKKHTFVVNNNHEIVHKIEKLAIDDKELAAKLAKQIYKLTLLAHKELKAEEMSDFVSESNTLMQLMLNKIS